MGFMGPGLWEGGGRPDSKMSLAVGGVQVPASTGTSGTGEEEGMFWTGDNSAEEIWYAGWRCPIEHDRRTTNAECSLPIKCSFKAFIEKITIWECYLERSALGFGVGLGLL